MSLLDRISAAVLFVYALTRMISAMGPRLPAQRFLSFVALVALLYLVVRTIGWVHSHVLWSLRNRLIVAYLFIAVVPVVLLLTMGGVAGYLSYLQFGAHLLHDDLEERTNLALATADVIADSAMNVPADTHEASTGVLTRPSITALLEVAKTDLPGIRVELNDGEDLLQRPGAEPGRRFMGIVQSEGKLLLKAVVAKQGPSGRTLVSVTAPISSELLDSLPSELGPIQLTPMRLASARDTEGIFLELNGRRFVPAGQIHSRRRFLGPKAHWFDLRVNGGSSLQAFAVESGSHEVLSAPVLASFSVRPSQLNHRLFASLGELGGPLVLVLILVGATFLVLEVAALITGIILTRTITNAVADLYDATQHVRKGDFHHRIRLQRRDQLGVLAESFNAMTGSFAELIEEQRKRQRLENELSIAREVQSQLFPQALPSVEGVHLAAVCRAARIVSGDYYDLIRLGPTCVGIAVADISGKGISAALLMASLQAALRSQVLLDGHVSTAELVRRLNRHLFVNTSDDRYATFFYAVYDSTTRTLAYTNAGHVAPFYVVGEKVMALDEGGTVVGLFDDCVYTQQTIHVAPGSLLVAYSDGLTEPENVYGEEFGARRLKEEILRRRDAQPFRLAEDLLAAAEQWGGTPEQADDMTVVVARLD